MRVFNRYISVMFVSLLTRVTHGLHQYKLSPPSPHGFNQFLADRTNGRAIATLLRLSSSCDRSDFPPRVREETSITCV